MANAECRLQIDGKGTVPKIAQRFSAGVGGSISLDEVPFGTTDALNFRRALLPSLKGLGTLGIKQPSAKALGYFHGNRFGKKGWTRFRSALGSTAFESPAAPSPALRRPTKSGSSAGTLDPLRLSQAVDCYNALRSSAIVNFNDPNAGGAVD